MNPKKIASQILEFDKNQVWECVWITVVRKLDSYFLV